MGFTPGKFLLSLVGLITSTGCYIADYNHTHVFNPNWPPHAKFHNGQTMSMGLVLGLCTQYYTFRNSLPSSSSSSTSSVVTQPQIERRKDDLNTAVLIGSLYWVTQLSAWFYPGSLPMDPEFGEGFPQLGISLFCFSVLGAGWWFERREVARVETSLVKEKKAL